MRAFSERFPDDASVTRTIAVNFNYEALSIADNLVSSGAGGWRGFLQIPHDLAVDADDNDATITITDPKTAHTLRIVLDAEWFKGFRVYSGQSDPIRGWGVSEQGFGPLTTVEYSLAKPGSVKLEFVWNDTEMTRSNSAGHDR